DQSSRERVEGAGEPQQSATGELVAQAGPAFGGGGGGVEHQKIPSGAVAVASSSAGAVTVSSARRPAGSSGRRWAASRKRSTSTGSRTPSARAANLSMYCSRAKGRAP